LAAPRKVDPDDVMVAGECPDHRAPRGARSPRSVNEQQRRRLPRAVVDHVHPVRVPEPQSPAPLGAASPTGAASRTREPHRPRQRQSPASTATTSTITQALRGAVESAWPIGRGTRSARGRRLAGRFRIHGLPAEFWPQSPRRSAPSIHRATGSGRRHRRGGGRKPGVRSPHR